MSLTISKGKQISPEAWLQAAVHLKVNVLFPSINYLIGALGFFFFFPPFLFYRPRLYSEEKVVAVREGEGGCGVYICNVTPRPEVDFCGSRLSAAVVEATVFVGCLIDFLPSPIVGEPW